MAFTKKNEDAVSPVIGVILMVAITVILAAVIAAFVFGMAGNVSKTKIVAVTAGRDNGNAANISVTNQGGQDASRLNNLQVQIAGAVVGNLTSSVGNSKSYAAGGTNKHVVVVGEFNDGTSQVLLDTYV